MMADYISEMVSRKAVTRQFLLANSETCLEKHAKLDTPSYSIIDRLCPLQDICVGDAGLFHSTYMLCHLRVF